MNDRQLSKLIRYTCREAFHLADRKTLLTTFHANLCAETTMQHHPLQWRCPHLTLLL